MQSTLSTGLDAKCGCGQASLKFFCHRPFGQLPPARRLAAQAKSRAASIRERGNLLEKSGLASIRSPDFGAEHRQVRPGQDSLFIDLVLGRHLNFLVSAMISPSIMKFLRGAQTIRFPISFIRTGCFHSVSMQDVNK